MRLRLLLFYYDMKNTRILGTVFIKYKLLQKRFLSMSTRIPTSNV